MHVIYRQVLVLRVAIVGIELQCKVSSVAVELAVDLQHTPSPLRVGICDTIVSVVVHHHRVGSFENLQTFVRQWVVGI